MTNDDEMAFEMALIARAAAVEALLRRLLDDRALSGEITRPDRLMAAMRHGVLNGGKRLRPFLVMESAALFSADGEAALRVARERRGTQFDPALVDCFCDRHAEILDGLGSMSAWDEVIVLDPRLGVIGIDRLR